MIEEKDKQRIHSANKRSINSGIILDPISKE